MLKRSAFYGLYIFIFSVIITLLDKHNFWTISNFNLGFLIIFILFFLGYCGLAYFFVGFFKNRSKKDKNIKIPLSIKIVSIIFLILSILQLLPSILIIYSFIMNPSFELFIYFMVSLLFLVLFLKTSLALYHGDNWAFDLLILALISIILIPFLYDITNYYLIWLVIILIVALVAYIITNKNVKSHFHND